MNGKKIIIIILLYRLPQSIMSRVYNTLIQYNRVEGKAKSIQKYRNEIFKEIIRHIKSIQNVNDIIIAGDINQFIGSAEIQQFYSEMGVQDIHHVFNKIKFNQMDNIHQEESFPIDSIAVSPNLIGCVEGYRLFETNELIISDH